MKKGKEKKSSEQMYFSFFFFFFCIYKDRLPEKQGFQASTYLYAFISFIYQYRICQTGLFFNTKSYTDSTSVTDAVANVCSGEPAPQSMEVWAAAPCWSPR